MNNNAFTTDMFRSKITFWGISLGFFWFLIIGGLLWYEIETYESLMIELAATEARANFNKDIAYRHWVASHGGVYVPVTDSSPTTPHMSGIDERNITSPSQRKLTLVSPAYMTRQLLELANQQNGTKGHITSLTPLRPENAPDEWENKALAEFTKGKKEVLSITTIEGTEYLRLIKPMLTTEGCLKCHSSQGHKINDIHGGISVSVPLAPYRTLTKKNIHFETAIHAIIFLFGLAGVTIAFTSLIRMESKRRTTQQALQESENNLRTVFEAADNVAFITTDLGGTATKIVGFSPGAEKIFGYSSTEIIGKNVEILHPALKAERFSRMQQPLSLGVKGYSGETKLIRKNGDLFSAILTIHPLHNGSGEIIGTVGVTVDISKRKQFEKALRQSEETARALLNATTESAFLLELDGTIITMNNLTAKKTGKSVEELLGTCIYDILPPQVANTQKEKINKVIETGKPLRFIDEQEELIIDLSVYPLFDSSGKVHQISVFARDITNEKQIEKALIESEKKFRTMFEQAPLSYQSLDRNGNVIEVNSTWLQTLGYKRSEVIGKNFVTFLAPGLGDNFHENFSYFIEMGEILGVEYKMVKKDGSQILVSFHGKIGKNRKGEFQQTHCVFTNISSQRSAQTTLKRDLELNKAIAGISTELLSETYEIKVVSDLTLNAALFLTNSSQGFVSSINKNTLESVGHTFTEMFGESCKESDGRIAFPIQDDGTYNGLWGDTLNSRIAFFTNTPTKYPSSTGIPDDHIELVNYMAVPVLMGENLLGLIALANSERDYNENDISIVQRIAEVFALAIHRQEYETQRTELEQSLRQLQKNEAIGALAGGIAHDFNNILTPIIGYSEFMKDDIPADSPLLENVHQILAAASRAKDLVKQILTFSRQHEQEIIPLRPHLVIREVIKLIRATIPSNIEIKQSIDNKCRTVMADPTQLHQIVMNLSTNAFQAIPNEGGVLTINLENIDLADDNSHLSLEAGPYIVLTVKDTGIGMDKVTLDKIFDPYFTTKPQGEGTGLGLSVVHGIVKNYKGSMDVTSSPGQGSQFQIYLPAVEQQKVIESDAEQPPPVKGNETIMLVDDELSILKLEEKLLQRLGYQIEMFSSSRDALGEIKSFPQKYDLVITDMTMPNMTGDILTQEIRKINANLPIIICTGFSQTMTPERAKFIEANGLLMKPVPGPELTKKVREVLDTAQDSSQTIQGSIHE